MSNKIYACLSELKGEPTAHLSGFKKVFLRNEDTLSQLTQFAYGVFKPGEICKRHNHPTMEEHFFFLKGIGVYFIGEEKFFLKAGTFLRIPAGMEHELVNDGDTDLEFVYFGVAID